MGGCWVLLRQERRCPAGFQAERHEAAESDLQKRGVGGDGPPFQGSPVPKAQSRAAWGRPLE